MAKTGYLTVKSPSSIESTYSPLLFNAVLQRKLFTSHENNICFFDAYCNSWQRVRTRQPAKDQL